MLLSQIEKPPAAREKKTEPIPARDRIAAMRHEDVQAISGIWRLKRFITFL